MKRADLWETYGLARSLLIYYRPRRIRKLRQFYGAFIQPGDLCFDLGAHAGNRVRAWLKLGARVVALEPQPAFMRLLQRWYGDHPDVVLLRQAVGAKRGQGTMYISRRTPTVTTLSADWAQAVRQDDSFRDVTWDDEQPVPIITLDDLIAVYGAPAFCKIDIEGYELAALQGLSTPLRQLSFELIPATSALAVACAARLAELGRYEYTFSPGESLRFPWQEWRSSGALQDWLQHLPVDAPSGDIYARLQTGG